MVSLTSNQWDRTVCFVVSSETMYAEGGTHEEREGGGGERGSVGGRVRGGSGVSDSAHRFGVDTRNSC